MCFRTNSIFLFVFLICFSVSAQKRQINVLIVDGFSNHDWKQTSKLTKAILEESNLFKVAISTVPIDSINKKNWNPEFDKYDVIIQNTNNIQNKALKWPRNVEEQLELYVKNGGGLYILHSGNNAFSHWSEYDKMLGMGWRSKDTGYALEIVNDAEIVRLPPGEGKNTSHGRRFDALFKF